MPFALKALLGVVHVSCICFAGLFIWDSLCAVDPRAYRAKWGWDTGWGRVRFLAALIGWCAIVAAGTKSALSPLLGNWPDAVLWICSGAALASLPLMGKLERLPQDRAELALSGEVLAWLTSALRESDELPTIDTPQGATFVQRQITLHKQSLAKRLQRWRAAGLTNQPDAASSPVDAASERPLASERHVVASENTAAPSLSARVSFKLGQAESLVAPVKVKALWKKLDQQLGGVSIVDASAIDQSRRHLELQLGKIQCVSADPGGHPLIQLIGNARNGRFSLTWSAGDSPLFPLKFEETEEGLITLAYVATRLPRLWAWGHGLYDCDHQPMMDECVTRMIADPHLPLGKEDLVLPTPGVRIRRGGLGAQVSVLCLRPGLGLVDRHLLVKSGMYLGAADVPVLTWGEGTLY